MTSASFWLWFFGPWVAIGLATAWFMGRRGHDRWSWIVLGIAFGPMVVPAAVAARRGATGRADRVDPGRPGRGGLDVLVGIDGSPASEAAVTHVTRLLGGVIGRLTLAIVVDHDTAANPEGVDRRRAEEHLVRARRRVHLDVEPALLVLGGTPADALVRHAVDADFGLLAVGTRGAGLSKAILGSVATELAARSPVPVLLAPAPLPQRIRAGVEATETTRTTDAAAG